MRADREKISTYQLMLLFIMSTLSPAIRLFPGYTAKGAKQAAWLAPAVAAIGIIVLVLIVQSFFIKPRNLNLSDVYMNVLGKIPGQIVLIIYSVYVIILTGVYARYYAERITSSILPETSIDFFILVMMCLVFYVLRGGLVPFARQNELLYYIFIFVFVVTGILTLPKIEIKYLLPICFLDILPVAKSAQGVLSIWIYFLFTFFFADKVNDKENVKKLGMRAVIVVVALSTWVIISTVGVLGSSLTARTALPFFVSVKQISVLDTLERLESIALSVWVAADFILITFLCYVALSIFKSLFSLSGTKQLASPLVLMIYIISKAIARNRFELEEATVHIFLQSNLILGLGIPIIVFIVGKIRGIVGNTSKGNSGNKGNGANKGNSATRGSSASKGNGVTRGSSATKGNSPTKGNNSTN